MTERATTDEILEFLEKAKYLLNNGKFDFVPRRKNLVSLAQLGITITDAKNEIFDISVSDYYKGPKDDFDRSRPGKIWEFKRRIKGMPLYIKLKIFSGKVINKNLPVDKAVDKIKRKKGIKK